MEVYSMARTQTNSKHKFKNCSIYQIFDIDLIKCNISKHKSCLFHVISIIYWHILKSICTYVSVDIYHNQIKLQFLGNFKDILKINFSSSKVLGLNIIWNFYTTLRVEKFKHWIPHRVTSQYSERRKCHALNTLKIQIWTKIFNVYYVCIYVFFRHDNFAVYLFLPWNNTLSIN